MMDDESAWEPVPSFYDLYNGMCGFLGYYYYNQSQLVTIEDQFKKIQQYNQIRLNEILLVIALAVFMTWLRHALTEYVCKPLGIHFQLTESNQKKLPESAWKFIFYFFAWLLTLYVSVIHHKFFQKPSAVWDDWDMNVPVSMEIYLVYIVQTSFYFHSLYATAFIDIWRKDSILLLMHHLVTIGLLSFSHAFRYNKIGVLVLLFHDIADILLEFSKINVYFKLRGKKDFPIHETIAGATFGVFTLTWFFTRIYWFPLKALYSAGVVTMERGLGSTLPLLFFMNAQLWVLFAMDLYWFSMILMFLVKIVTGQMEELEDIREYDIEEKSKLKQHKVGSSEEEPSARKMEATVQNGVHLNGSFGTTIRART